MLRKPANALRVLLLLAIFLAGSTGHSFAMAAGPMSGHGAHTTSLQTHHPAMHAEVGAICKGSHCAAPDQSCCIMGQCMLGLTTLAELGFPKQLRAEIPKSSCMTVADATSRLPFRPPA